MVWVCQFTTELALTSGSLEALWKETQPKPQHDPEQAGEFKS